MPDNCNIADPANAACNIAAALLKQAQQQAGHVAIHYPLGNRAKRLHYASASYAELNELADDYARGLLEYGIGRGARTALMLTPGLDFFAIFFALFKVGAVPILIDPGIGLKPLKTCLAKAAPAAFIGVRKAHVARLVFGWTKGVKLVTAGANPGWGGISTKQLRQLGRRSSGAVLAATQQDEMAAIMFTSGSTGIPKGVVYCHRHFVAQMTMLQAAFDIKAGEVDLPTFPPFALFDPAMGMSTVVPYMDPTRPAKADPKLLVQTIERFSVTNIFGSPALLNVLGRHTETHNIHLACVRRVISAGAAMPVSTLRRVQKALPADADVFTPYGATECLPVSNISGTQLNAEIEQRTASGQGTCVGRSVVPNELKIIAVTEEPLASFANALELPPGISGEIVVQGPTTTAAYWQRDEQTLQAKIIDGNGRTWHRMGDVGYFDKAGRLWYCGRKSQRVITPDRTLYPDQIEAIFNIHPEVARTALVGIGNRNRQTPVLCVELLQKPNGKKPGKHRRERIRTDLLQIGRNNPMVAQLRHVLFHKSFPVDIRHNAKIGRGKLALWAAKKLL